MALRYTLMALSPRSNGAMTAYQEPNVTVYQGHALDVLKGMSDESVDCVMTSPPYWGLRTYKTEPQIWSDNHVQADRFICRHEWSNEKIVSCGRNDNAEKGGALFHGTSNKTYAGDSKASQGNFCLKCGAWRGELGLEPTIELYIEHLIQIFSEVRRVLKKTGTCWVNIDDSYAANRSYQVPDSKWCDVGNDMPRKIDGIPAKSLCLIPSRFALAMVENGWRLRNDICWYKSNPMPESVKDRFTGSWEHLFFFVKRQRYWFEQQFETLSPLTIADSRNETGRHTYAESKWQDTADKPSWYRSKVFVNSLQGRNKRDVWEINTQPYPEAHFATFPEKLCETPILSGCPKDGVVLDPFCGSGKALSVAKRLGRKAIGIDLNPDYCKLAIKEVSKISIPMEL